MNRPRLAEVVTRKPDFQTKAFAAAVLTPRYHRGLVLFGRRAHTTVGVRILGSLGRSSRCHRSLWRPPQKLGFREVWNRECVDGFVVRRM